jgi:hypothetical protein
MSNQSKKNNLSMSVTDKMDEMNISKLIDKACETTISKINAIETESDTPLFRTMLVLQKDHTSYLYGYLNYYSGVCEGSIFSMFLDEFHRNPTLAEKEFIKKSYEQKFETVKTILVDFATKAYHADSK